MSTLRITVDDRDSLRTEALNRVRAADADDCDDVDGTAVPETTTVAFPSYDVLTTHLTPIRLELLRAIADHEPASVSDTADIVDRDVGDVSRDIQRLESIGVLEVDERGPGKPTKPIVPYDRIEISVDYPLIDTDSEPDESHASAD